MRADTERRRNRLDPKGSSRPTHDSPTPPVGTGTDKDYNFIELFYGNGIELQFEIGRGKGIAPDRFHISGTSLTGAKYSGDFYPKIVEILEGGALRRTTEYDHRNQRYEITEERF